MALPTRLFSHYCGAWSTDSVTTEANFPGLLDESFTGTFLCHTTYRVDCQSSPLDYLRSVRIESYNSSILRISSSEYLSKLDPWEVLLWKEVAPYSVLLTALESL
jgi:hypothetical protein